MINVITPVAEKIVKDKYALLTNYSGKLANVYHITTYLSRFAHPQFYYGGSGSTGVITDASTSISGKELGLYLGLPRATVPGLPVVEHAEFGK